MYLEPRSVGITLRFSPYVDVLEVIVAAKLTVFDKPNDVAHGVIMGAGVLANFVIVPGIPHSQIRQLIVSQSDIVNDIRFVVASVGRSLRRDG